MELKSRDRRSGAVWTTLLVSLLLHVVVLLCAVPLLDLRLEEPPPPPAEERPFEVSVETEVLLEEEAPAPPEEELAERREARPEEPLPKPPEPTPEPEPKPERMKEIPLDPRTAVVQESTEQRPTEADFIAAAANQVEEQTVARETTTEDVLPGRAPEAQSQASEPVAQEEQQARVAMRRSAPERRDPPSPRDPAPQQAPEKTTEPVEEAEVPDEMAVEDSGEPTPKLDPRQLFQPSMQDYNRVMGDRDQDPQAARRLRHGRRLLDGWEERDAAMRASIENFVSNVKPGNHTALNAHANIFATYINAIHRKIHPRWGTGYLVDLDMHTSPGDPLNDPDLNTLLEFVIKASDGEVEQVNIVRSSGELRFDAEAVTIAHAVGPHPNPPPEIVSPDGRIYIHWNFWRGPRQCGTFGASVFIVEKDKG